MEGGGEGPYLVTYLSRQFGPVYVMRGKMPTFPDTYAGQDGKGVATRTDAQTQYWSLVRIQVRPSTSAPTWALRLWESENSGDGRHGSAKGHSIAVS